MLLSSSGSSISVDLGACHDNNGAQLSTYSLYVAEGAHGSNFQIAYSGLELSAITVSGLTSGLLYHLKTTASNQIGESEFSSEVSCYAAALPSQPADLVKGAASSRHQIELLWDVHPDGEIPVTGYAVEVDQEHFGVFTEIWDGRQHPDIRQLVYSDVE